VPALTVAKLSKSFGRKKALSNIDLTVEDGEMVALIGASGSGKSTLIRHIAGLEHSDRGACRIDVLDRPMQQDGRMTREARGIRRDVGVIFQQFNLVNRLPLLTNVLIGALGRIPGWRGTLGFFSHAEQLRAMQAIDRVGIAAAARQRASTLSGGQQQRAAIARALVQGAKLLLADEPIASLDPASAKRVMETLSDINRRDGITILVSLHQVEYARRYCPRTVALRDGVVAYDGPSTALTKDFLRELYGEASEELILPDAPLHEEPVRRHRAVGQPALAAV
jgi:phosphonate transport system ATP-binding protein